MKTIRSLMVMAGLPLLVLALGATGTKGQILRGPDFAGTFTLPLQAQWGSTILPAGEYSLYYGQPFPGGAYAVEVIGNEKGSPHGVFLEAGTNDLSAAKNALVCVRNGNALVVRALEMPAIGKSATFPMPHGAQLTARNAKHNGYTQLAEAPVLIQRIPVKLNTK